MKATSYNIYLNHIYNIHKNNHKHNIDSASNPNNINQYSNYSNSLAQVSNTQYSYQLSLHSIISVILMFQKQLPSSKHE